MLDLLTAFEDFAPEMEVKEPSIDREFITDFLLPYFHDLPREQLAAKVAEIISMEQVRQASALRLR